MDETPFAATISLTALQIMLLLPLLLLHLLPFTLTLT